MTNKSGFTLAEVLTTLMVIGVVAAMTIPTLMNSTNEQQLKVAYKKALSVLGQGVQLMTAKEEECVVTSSNELAACFQSKVLSGTRTDNVITTADGMMYKFIYNSAKSTNAGSTARTIDEICGDISTTGYSNAVASSYDGTNAACGVIVDLNGSKGTSSITATALDGAMATEQQPIIVTGTGVRPIYTNNTDATSGYNGNKGWTWMYGDANPI